VWDVGVLLLLAEGDPLGSIVYLALLVFVLAGMWKVFTKAGQPGWAVLIPILGFGDATYVGSARPA